MAKSKTQSETEVNYADVGEPVPTVPIKFADTGAMSLDEFLSFETMTRSLGVPAASAFRVFAKKSGLHTASRSQWKEHWLDFLAYEPDCK